MAEEHSSFFTFPRMLSLVLGINFLVGTNVEILIGKPQSCW